MTGSKELYLESRELTPGGVSSPVRAFRPYPLFISKGEGCMMTDTEGNEYLDMCMSYGPLIAGHANPVVLDAVREQIAKGTVYGAPSEPELALIKRIHANVPSAEMVRLACSGTEATMHAIRLARGYTGKKGIVKMNGGFHGAHDSVLVNAGSGSAGGVPSSAGVLEATASYTYTAEYNDIESMSALLDSNNDIACVIMEPVLGNVGVVTPKGNYLQEVRKLTAEHDVVLIFDEVITGFRLSAGGAQALYGVTPDLTTMGKIIGGGFPAGAFAGKKEIMENVAPQGPVYAAGTFAGNPVSAAAGLAQIELMLKDDNYRTLNVRTSKLAKAVEDLISDAGLEGCVNYAGSMMSVFFGITSATTGKEAMKADRAMFDRLFRSMLKKGIYLPPSAMEVDFLSLAHDDDAVKRFEEAFAGSVRDVKG